MVNITPVSPGSVLGWREVQVWLRSGSFLKLMRDHETQSNVHSLEFLLCFPNNFMSILSLLLALLTFFSAHTHICRVRDYNLSPLKRLPD